MLKKFNAKLALPSKPGEEPGTTNPPAQTTHAISPEFARELREEAAAHRVARKTAEEAKTAAEAAAAKAKADADEAIAAANRSANDRLLRSELKALAIQAGIVDLDGLKLADLSKLKLNDAGEVEGGAEFISEFKKAKPFLFTTGAASTSSTKDKPVPPTTPEAVDVRSMSREEYAKYRAKKTASR